MNGKNADTSRPLNKYSLISITEKIKKSKFIIAKYVIIWYCNDKIDEWGIYMEKKIFGISIDKRTVRVAFLFLCASLVMTGHFISTAATNPAKDVTVVRAGDDTAARDAPGGAEGAGLPGGGGGGAAAGGAEADGLAAGEGANGAGGAADVGSGAALDAQGAGTGGAGGARSVRDGYSVPGGTDVSGSVIPDQEKIYVYVTGAVKKPGVYELARSSMVIDAVELAGGFTDQADAENVNMVYRLESNAMLNIKRKPAPNYENIILGADAPGADTDKANSPEVYGGAVDISYNYDGALMTGDNAAEDTTGPAAKRVNVNTASAEELATLPGIGKATAESIITYRNKQKFDRIEDLMKVSGIKQAKFDALKDYVTC